MYEDAALSFGLWRLIPSSFQLSYVYCCNVRFFRWIYEHCFYQGL